jgi:hypothetical protein
LKFGTGESHAGGCFAAMNEHLFAGDHDANATKIGS